MKVEADRFPQLDYSVEAFKTESHRVDPALATIGPRVKKPQDALYVRDAILETVARLRDTQVAAKEPADARSAQKYGLLRTLDNTERIASTLASYVHFKRSYGTLNRNYRLVDSLNPADLQAAARKYLVDDGMVVTHHLSTRDLSVVFITKDAAGLKNALDDAFSPITYDAAMAQAVLDEDKLIDAVKLGITPENVKITPAAQAFAE
jgi:predicted Zn-dependent peptidase